MKNSLSNLRKRARIRRHDRASPLQVWPDSLRLGFSFLTTIIKEKPRENLNFELESNKSSGPKDWDLISCNSIITKILQGGKVNDARHVFDKMTERDVISWTAMIAGYARNGRVEEARKLFDNMPERNVVSWNAMVTGYIQNGGIEEAIQLFNKMPERNVVSWTVMIAGCGKGGKIMAARWFFDKMHKRDLVSWNAMIAVYIENCAIDEARHLFDKMPRRTVVTWTSMITGYAQSGRIEDARHVFDKMPKRNVVSWTAMITGYAQNGHGEEALQLFSQMQQAGMKPNQTTFTTVLNACTTMTAVEQGNQVHTHIIKMGCEPDVILENALITMYAKCSRIDNGHRVFKEMAEQDVVSWNAMIGGYAQNGRVADAHYLFDTMPKRDMVSWTTMISGYSQNGRAEDARCLFDKMPNQDAISWTAMIAGFTQNGHDEEALKLFSQMCRRGIKPIQSTFTSILTAYASLSVLEQGLQIHAHIIKTGFETDVSVENSLISMYAKCGSIGDARQVFDEMPERDVVSWNSMMVAFAQHGNGKVVLKLFEQLQEIGMKPNHITFLGVLSACSHAGLVDEGRHYFNSMSQDYCIIPTADHYACMVDLLGRAGHLDEAEDFINKMPFKPHAAVWGALLSACKIHANMELGKYAAEWLFELEPQNATALVVLANMYALAGRWNDEAKVRLTKRDKRIKKNPGCSWIVVKGRVHAFLAGDIVHPQRDKIYAMLEILTESIEAAGYVLNPNFLLHDADEE